MEEELDDGIAVAKFCRRGREIPLAVLRYENRENNDDYVSSSIGQMTYSTLAAWTIRSRGDCNKVKRAGCVAHGRFSYMMTVLPRLK